jgi:hypothetical protein
MVELQSLTGMRPGEVCIMRGCDITTPKDNTCERAFPPPKDLARQRVQTSAVTRSHARIGLRLGLGLGL